MWLLYLCDEIFFLDSFIKATFFPIWYRYCVLFDFTGFFVVLYCYRTSLICRWSILCFGNFLLLKKENIIRVYHENKLLCPCLCQWHTYHPDFLKCGYPEYIFRSTKLKCISEHRKIKNFVDKKWKIKYLHPTPKYKEFQRSVRTFIRVSDHPSSSVRNIVTATEMNAAAMRCFIFEGL